MSVQHIQSLLWNLDHNSAESRGKVQKAWWTAVLLAREKGIMAQHDLLGCYEPLIVEIAERASPHFSESISAELALGVDGGQNDLDPLTFNPHTQPYLHELQQTKFSIRNFQNCVLDEDYP